jgi:hypothetical protein
MPNRITGKKPKTDAPIDGVNPSEKPDGKKPQLIDQFRLFNKAAGENTKKIKADWHDSITTAHKMLVNVNTELDSILAELDEISEALKNLGKKTGLGDAVNKFNDVQKEIKLASETANRFVDSFNRSLPPRLVKAGSAIEKFTKKDFEKLEEKLGKDKVKRIKNTFAKIRALEQNVKNNFQDPDQPADHSVKKKSQKARHGQDVSRESSDNSSSEVSTASEGSSSHDSKFDTTEEKSNSSSSDGSSSVTRTVSDESSSEASDSKKSSDNERTKADLSASSYFDE